MTTCLEACSWCFSGVPPWVLLWNGNPYRQGVCQPGFGGSVHTSKLMHMFVRSFLWTGNHWMSKWYIFVLGSECQDGLGFGGTWEVAMSREDFFLGSGLYHIHCLVLCGSHFKCYQIKRYYPVVSEKLVYLWAESYMKFLFWGFTLKHCCF